MFLAVSREEPLWRRNLHSNCSFWNLLRQPNAAPEWQAGGFWRHSRERVEACPLEGLVMHWQRTKARTGLEPLCRKN